MRKELLTSLFVIVIAMMGTVAAQRKMEIYSKAAHQMLQKDISINVLDVRTPVEYKNGHIKGAINIDISQNSAFNKIDKLNHNAKYIVHCYTNRRSSFATDYMVQKGFKVIYQIMDGFYGWESNNLPIQK